MTIDSFILIGGRSSRMGRDKALVEFGGQTLAERAMNTVSEALPEAKVTFVAANQVQFGVEAIRGGGPFVFDLVEGRGPAGGIYTALAHAQTDWIFVLACDYPFVSKEIIFFLSSLISEKFGAIVPEQEDGRMQPLCAFYKTDAARPVIEEIVDRPRVPPPMHEIVMDLSPRLVKYAEYDHLGGAKDFFININNASDLEEAREIERKLLPEK
jgi:molybdopterin-guanine dinucleotide biosynthesis protein A